MEVIDRLGCGLTNADKEVADRFQLVSRELRTDLHEGGVHRCVELHKLRSPGPDHSQLNLPPVRRVALANDPTALFETVEDAGHRRWMDVQLTSQHAWRNRPDSPDVVEQLDISSSQLEESRDRAVKAAELRSHRPECHLHLPDHLRARGRRLAHFVAYVISYEYRIISAPHQKEIVMNDFRLTRTLRIGNRFVTPLIRVGLPMGPMALLTVRGRKSGLPRTTPVAVAPLECGWRLVAAYGIVDWVKNLRANGTAVISRRGREVQVEANELNPEEAAPLLRESLIEAGPITRRVIGSYFSAAPDAPLTDWVDEARRHPVFILKPVRFGA